MANNNIKEFPSKAAAIEVNGEGFRPNTPAIAEEVNYSFKNVSVVTTALANTLAKESEADLNSNTTSDDLTKITDKLVFDNESSTSQPGGTRNGQAACVVENPSTKAKEVKWAGFCWGEAAQGEYYLNSYSEYSLVLNDQGGFGFYDVLIDSDSTKNDYNFPIFNVNRTSTSDGKAIYYGTLVEATSNTKSNPASNNIVVKVSRKTPGSSQGDDPTVAQTQTYVFSDSALPVFAATTPAMWNDSIMNDVLRVGDLIDKDSRGRPKAVSFRESGFGLTKLKMKTIIIEKNVDYSKPKSEEQQNTQDLLLAFAKNTGQYMLSTSVEVTANSVYSGGILTYGFNSNPENVLISYVIPIFVSGENPGQMTTRSLFSTDHPKVIIEYIEVPS